MLPRASTEARRLTGSAQVAIFRTHEVGSERSGTADTEGVLARRELPSRDFDVGWGREGPHDRSLSVPRCCWLVRELEEKKRR